MSITLKKRIKETAKNLLMRYYYYTSKREKNVVLFSSFGGKQYSDNPRAISEKLHELMPEIKCIWLFNSSVNKTDYPDYIEAIPSKSLAALKAMARAKVWVFNVDQSFGTFKGKDQYYIQTWHGDRVPKKVKYDAVEAMGTKKYRSVKLIESQICDLCIAGSDLGEQVYRSAFKYHGEVLKVGMPRNDCLVNQDAVRISEIKKKLGVQQKNVLLYAPTFRDHSTQKQLVSFDLKAVLIKLEEMTREPWVIFVRAHVLTNTLVYQASEKIIDVSHYNDMADLLLISDVLVSDYSSSIGDFILKDKPVFLYQSDYQEYQSDCRAFNIDVRRVGFLFAENMEDFMDLLENMDSYDYHKMNKRILEQFNTVETGKSSEVVCKRIIHWLS